MRLISARQAWHDSQYESRDSVMFQQDKRPRAKNASSSRCAHMATMGRIQHAIASLTKPMQHFGHHLYSPLATVRDQDVARTLVWFTWDKPAGLPKVKESRAYCLVLPALVSYQGVVTGGRDEWTPGRIAEFVADWYGEKISVSQWARDWAPIWEGLQRTISEIDQRVLEPVELAIDGEREVA